MTKEEILDVFEKWCEKNCGNYKSALDYVMGDDAQFDNITDSSPEPACFDGDLMKELNGENCEFAKRCLRACFALRYNNLILYYHDVKLLKKIGFKLSYIFASKLLFLTTIDKYKDSWLNIACGLNIYFSDETEKVITSEYLTSINNTNEAHLYFAAIMGADAVRRRKLSDESLKYIVPFLDYYIRQNKSTEILICMYQYDERYADTLSKMMPECLPKVYYYLANNRADVNEVKKCAEYFGCMKMFYYYALTDKLSRDDSSLIRKNLSSDENIFCEYLQAFLRPEYMTYEFLCRLGSILTDYLEKGKGKKSLGIFKKVYYKTILSKIVFIDESISRSEYDVDDLPCHIDMYYKEPGKSDTLPDESKWAVDLFLKLGEYCQTARKLVLGILRVSRRVETFRLIFYVIAVDRYTRRYLFDSGKIADRLNDLLEYGLDFEEILKAIAYKNKKYLTIDTSTFSVGFTKFVGTYQAQTVEYCSKLINRYFMDTFVDNSEKYSVELTAVYYFSYMLYNRLNFQKYDLLIGLLRSSQNKLQEAASVIILEEPEKTVLKLKQAYKCGMTNDDLINVADKMWKLFQRTDRDYEEHVRTLISKHAGETAEYCIKIISRCFCDKPGKFSFVCSYITDAALYFADMLYKDLKYENVDLMAALLMTNEKKLIKYSSEHMLEDPLKYYKYLTDNMRCFDNKALKVAQMIINKVQEQNNDLSDFTSDEEVLSYVESNYDIRLEKTIKFIPEALFDNIRFSGSFKAAPPQIIRYIYMRYMNVYQICKIADCSKIAEMLNKEDLCRCVDDIYKNWLDNEAPVNQKMIVLPEFLWGSASNILILKNHIFEWNRYRKALADFCIKAAALCGSSCSLLMLSQVADRFPGNIIGKTAAAAVEQAAADQGLTRDQLNDKIIPSLGFDKSGSTIAYYGSRTFTVTLMPDFSVQIIDDSTKKIIKSLPKPNQNDDAVKAAAAKKNVSEIKKQLKSIYALQNMRLYSSFRNARKWSVSEWTQTFIDNPVMNVFARTLIWGIYDKDKLVLSFRPCDDRTFSDMNDNEVKLPADAEIALIHPMDMNKDDVAAWILQLEDYNIKQPFSQISAHIVTVSDIDVDYTYNLTGYKDMKVNAGAIKSLKKYGMVTSESGDYGSFCGYELYDKTADAGLFVGSDDFYYSQSSDEEVTLTEVFFYRTSYDGQESSDEKVSPLDISPRFVSCCLDMLESILNDKYLSELMPKDKILKLWKWSYKDKSPDLTDAISYINGDNNKFEKIKPDHQYIFKYDPKLVLLLEGENAEFAKRCLRASAALNYENIILEAGDVLILKKIGFSLDYILKSPMIYLTQQNSYSGYASYKEIVSEFIKYYIDDVIKYITVPMLRQLENASKVVYRLAIFLASAAVRMGKYPDNEEKEIIPVLAEYAKSEWSKGRTQVIACIYKKDDSYAQMLKDILPEALPELFDFVKDRLEIIAITRKYRFNEYYLFYALSNKFSEEEYNDYINYFSSDIKLLNTLLPVYYLWNNLDIGFVGQLAMILISYLKKGQGKETLKVYESCYIVHLISYLGSGHGFVFSVEGDLSASVDKDFRFYNYYSSEECSRTALKIFVKLSEFSSLFNDTMFHVFKVAAEKKYDPCGFNRMFIDYVSEVLQTKSIGNINVFENALKNGISYGMIFRAVSQIYRKDNTADAVYKPALIEFIKTCKELAEKYCILNKEDCAAVLYLADILYRDAEYDGIGIVLEMLASYDKTTNKFVCKLLEEDNERLFKILISKVHALTGQEHSRARDILRKKYADRKECYDL